MLSVWFCVSSRASGLLPPADRQSSVQGQSVRRSWSRGGDRLLVGRHLRCRHSYAGVVKTGGWELLALLGSFEHIFFSVFRWWVIRRVWMWWNVQILSSYSWVLPTIPVMLVLGKMIRWEDYVVRLWQRHSSKLQIFSGLVPGMYQ